LRQDRVRKNLPDKGIGTWDHLEVLRWLEDIDLQQYQTIFLQKKVNGQDLVDLSLEQERESTLEAHFEVKTRLHKNKILREIDACCQNPDHYDPNGGDKKGKSKRSGSAGKSRTARSYSALQVDTSGSEIDSDISPLNHRSSPVALLMGQMISGQSSGLGRRARQKKTTKETHSRPTSTRNKIREDQWKNDKKSRLNLRDMGGGDSHSSADSRGKGRRSRVKAVIEESKNIDLGPRSCSNGKKAKSKNLKQYPVKIRPFSAPIHSNVKHGDREGEKCYSKTVECDFDDDDMDELYGTPEDEISPQARFAVVKPSRLNLAVDGLAENADTPIKGTVDRTNKDSSRSDHSTESAGSTEKTKKLPFFDGLDLNLKSSTDSAVEDSYEFTIGGTLDIKGYRIKEKVTDTPEGVNSRKSTSSFNFEDLIMLQELGKGASGKVCKALHVPTMKMVAVKTVKMFEKTKRHQFVNELKLLFKNNHISLDDTEPSSTFPWLLKFHDAFTTRDEMSVSIVLEYMDAGTLQDFVKVKYRMDYQALQQVSFCILKALDFLHQRKQIHRDIKPSNILLNRSGHVKIGDFGISRQLAKSEDLAKTFVGTLVYMSPERIAGTLLAWCPSSSSPPGLFSKCT
jgi:hypothetical protein